jgi:uracil-DNA glycosylase
MTKPQDVKVVLIANEPYPYFDGKWDGFAYSTPAMLPWKKVADGSEVPKWGSIQQARLFKELIDDQRIPRPKHGSLLKWARQGVFLWNYTLTGVHGAAGAHLHWGWDELSREVLELIALENPRAVFVPWGLPSFGKNAIDQIVPKNTVIYSGKGPETIDDRNWYGSKPFTKINAILKGVGETPINWSINF